MQGMNPLWVFTKIKINLLLLFNEKNIYNLPYTGGATFLWANRNGWNNDVKKQLLYWSYLPI